MRKSFDKPEGENYSDCIGGFNNHLGSPFNRIFTPGHGSANGDLPVKP